MDTPETLGASSPDSNPNPHGNADAQASPPSAASAPASGQGAASGGTAVPGVESELDKAMAGIDMEAVAARADSAGLDRAFKEDDLVEGTIMSVSERDVVIDLGGKAQGVVARDEFLPGYEPPVGERIHVLVASIDPETELVRLSKKRADVRVMWRDLKVGDVMEGIISGMNKGGLEVAIKGIRAFIPASHVDSHFVKDVSDLFGQSVRVEVIKIEPDGENLVVSRRKVLEREAKESKTKILEELKVGDVRKGRVRNITDFGAFVDLGGVDGLLHVSDMSWGRVGKPSEVLKLNDEIEVKVLKIQQGTGKISLGLKQLLANPWQTAADRYSAGMTLKGRVIRHADFGAFVEVEAGIEGLVPLSEMSWNRRVRHPKEICQEGDVVEVAVLSVDSEKQRMSLSLKQVAGDPWTGAADRFPVGEKVKAKVLRLADFGAFVELEPGVDGMIHISELSNDRVRSVGDVLKQGQEVEARIIRVDEPNRKIGLSMKPEPSPEELKAVEVANQQAEQEAKARKKRLEKPRRGGLDIGWEQGLGNLDPSRFG